MSLKNLSYNYVVYKAYHLNCKIFPYQRILQSKSNERIFYIPLCTNIKYETKKRKLTFFCDNYDNICKRKKSFQNLYEVLLAQSIVGALLCYKRELRIIGITYEVKLRKKEQKTSLIFRLGHSHQVNVVVPDYVTATIPKKRKIVLHGIDLQKLKNLAFVIRKLREPFIYKLKGIYLKKEKPLIKEGKKT